MLMVIPEPTHSQKILDQNERKYQLQNATNNRLFQARQPLLDLLVEAVAADDPDAILRTAELQNEI